MQNNNPANNVAQKPGKTNPNILRLDDKEYDLTNMDEKSQKIFNHFIHVHRKLSELRNMKVILNRAKNGYIEDLKYEIIKNKTGIDIENFLLSD